MNEDLYQIYLEEIEAIKPCSREENAVLSVALATGDGSAKNRLVEGNLKAVLAYTKEYEGQGVILNDLVQEANMALILAIDSYAALTASIRMEHPGMSAQMPEGALEQYLEEKVKGGLQAVIDEYTQAEKSEEEILARVNVLKDVSQRLAEELGREASVEELAETMKMSEEEIRDIMKLTLDAMSVPEAEE